MLCIFQSLQFQSCTLVTLQSLTFIKDFLTMLLEPNILSIYKFGKYKKLIFRDKELLFVTRIGAWGGL